MGVWKLFSSHIHASYFSGYKQSFLTGRCRRQCGAAAAGGCAAAAGPPSPAPPAEDRPHRIAGSL